jgi:hypothetical protein
VQSGGARPYDLRQQRLRGWADRRSTPPTRVREGNHRFYGGLQCRREERGERGEGGKQGGQEGLRLAGRADVGGIEGLYWWPGEVWCGSEWGVVGYVVVGDGRQRGYGGRGVKCLPRARYDRKIM